jgi:TPR repeat protein
MPANWVNVPLEDLRAAAEGGDAGAQCALGKKIGEEDEESYAEAAAWFRAAAEQGLAEAQDELGDCFYYGNGVDEDDAQAVGWYRKAAEQGHATAQNNLGFCFKRGEGVGQDFAEAASWCRKAAEQGHTNAENELGSCLYNGKGVSQDRAEAASWFRKAAEQGHAGAQNWLAFCFKRGEGVDQDDAEAARWFQKAAEQGNMSACVNYGELLAEGKGVARNCDEALFWLRKCPDSQRARAKIAEIEKETGALEKKAGKSRDVVAHIRAGDSVFGTAPENNTLLHTAVMNLALDSVALLYEHPSFDKLVVLPNTAGQLAREVVGDKCSAYDRDGSTARVIASVLSCRRSTRAACLLWCVKQVSQVPTVDRRTVLPPEVGEIIARFVAVPLVASNMSQLLSEPAKLVQSVQSSWKHAPTSVGDVLWRDRLAVTRSETSACAHLDWLREEADSLRGRILGAEGKLAELFQNKAILEMPAEHHRIDDMRAKLLSVADARRDLLRQMGADAFVAELALLDAEVVDFEKQIDEAELSRAGHMEGGRLESAIASRDLATALRQRLAEVHAEASDIRAELLAVSSGGDSFPTARGGAKRGADEVQTTEGGGGAEPESKRAKGDS